MTSKRIEEARFILWTCGTRLFLDVPGDDDWALCSDLCNSAK